MKDKMQHTILVCFGFFSALTFHPIWGRISAAFLGISIAIILVSSMSARERFLLFLVLPVICFLLTTYAGYGLNNWLNSNTPESVVGDIIYYFSEAGKSAVPAVEGTTALVTTGDPDSLTNSGLKLHHLMMLLFSVFGAFVLCFVGYKDKVQRVVS